MTALEEPRRWSVLGAAVLLTINGLLWLVLASATLAGQEGALQSSGSTAPWIIGAMYANAAILGALAFGLTRGGAAVLHIALVWVGINFVLSFTDEVGVSDVVAGMLNGVTLGVLLGIRRASRADR